jgi:ABC-type uncharacterized transport system ATPase subunit
LKTYHPEKGYAGLDELAHKSTIWGLRHLPQNRDIFSTVCDDITVLDFGTRISHGSPAEVRRDPAVISAYLGVEDVSAETNTTSHAANTTEV